MNPAVSPPYLAATQPDLYMILARAEGHTLLGAERLSNLYNAVKKLGDTGENVALAELGTYKGGSALVMHLAAPQLPIHIFDTFEGMPDSNGAQEVHKAGDFNDTSFQTVSEFIRSNSPNPGNVFFHQGFFPGTFHLQNTDFGVVHLDGDYYETTKAGIEVFYPRLVDGGYLFFDDYGWPNCPGVRRAIYESLLLTNSNEVVETTTGTEWQAFIKRKLS